MADAEATGLIKVKADTSQAVRATNDLTESQKKLGSAVEASASKFDKMLGGAKGAFDGIGKTLTGLNQGLEVIDKVIRVVDKAVDAQLVEKANQFGIKVKNAADATTQLHKALAASPTALDEATRGLLKTRDAMDDLGKVTQQVVSDLVVPVINVLVDKVKDLIEYGSDFIDLLSRGGVTRLRAQEQKTKATQADLAGQQFRADVGSAGYYSDTLAYSQSVRAGSVSGLGGLSEEAYLQALIGDSGNGRGIGRVTPRAATRKGIPVVVVGVESGGGQLGGVFGEGRGIEGSTQGGGAYDQFGNPVGRVGSSDGIAIGRPSGLAGLYGGETFYGNSSLASMTDPLAETKKNLGDTATASGAAFASLSGGITAAVDAAITGSDAIGKAAAKASSAVLKTLAVEAAGRAVYEGALAIGSLAIGDAKGATLHGLAAAKYAAAAAVEGSLAAGLGALANGGGGSSGGGSAAPAAGFGSPTGGSASSGPISVTINLGYGVGADAAPKIEEAVRRGIRSAQLRGGRSGYATEVSG